LEVDVSATGLAFRFRRGKSRRLVATDSRQKAVEPWGFSDRRPTTSRAGSARARRPQRILADPRLVGERVEVEISQRELVAVALRTGGLACRHRRSFAKHLTFTDHTHQRKLDRLRGERKRRRREPELKIRPLSRYDQLIPA